MPREEFNFDKDQDQLRVSMAITAMFRHHYHSTGWLTEQKMYESLRFNPGPSIQQFKTILLKYSDRFAVDIQRINHSSGHGRFREVRWFKLLTDDEKRYGYVKGKGKKGKGFKGDFHDVFTFGKGKGKDDLDDRGHDKGQGRGRGKN